MATLTLYYATNRNYEGEDRWHPDSYGTKFSDDGMENLRFGFVSVDARFVHRVDQLGQPHAVLDGGVEFETQRRRVADHQGARQCVAQESGRALETALNLGIRAVFAEHQVVYPRRSQVAGDGHRRDGHIADSPVLHIAAQQLGQLTLDLFAQPPRCAASRYLWL